MAPDFQWAKSKMYRAEFGIEPGDFANVGPSPYTPGRPTAVSVGSMLFDPSFFQHAAAKFPEVDFHIIGCGTTFDAPANVHIHPEMKFVDTLPYVKHATIGIAPYRPAPGVEYLAESSLKLAQYQYFALPAVCPDFAVGGIAGRFGYEPGDPSSIQGSVRDALKAVGHIDPRSFLTWKEVADRVIRPEDYPETSLN
jgi:2-beta-glucuronyltransferase